MELLEAQDLTDLPGVPGWEGSVGPFPGQYSLPHVYARDIGSGAGNCVCGSGLPDLLHVQAAPGIAIPGRDPLTAGVRLLGKSIQPPAIEKRFVLGLAYQAGRDPRIQKGADGGRDYFEPDELEKACWSFLPGGANVGLFHSDHPAAIGRATVVESYIYRNPVPWTVGEALVVKQGDWVVGAVLDPDAWRLYKQGRITGWSPQGHARRVTPGS